MYVYLVLACFIVSWVMMKIGLSNIVYFVLFWMFYKFSGAHNKPTSDSKYDPTVEHQNNILHKLVRKYENYLLRQNKMLLNSQPCDPIPVREINAKDVTPELFRYMTHNYTEPIVIRNLFKNTPAVNKWNADYLLQEPYCKTVLKTLHRGKHKTTAYTNFNQKLDCLDVTLEDSLNAMKNGSTDIYINNVTKIFIEHPDLVADMNLDQIGSKLGLKISNKTWLNMNCFIGRAGTLSSLHCATAGNLFFLAEGGLKEWTFIPAEYAPYLKMTPAKEFLFAVSGYNLRQPNNLLQKIPRFTCTLEKGDALLNTPWTLHHVENKIDLINENPITIGVAIRLSEMYDQCWKNNAMYTLMSPYWWRMHPTFLWFVEKIIGNEKARRMSMLSDESIVDNLTGFKTHQN